MGFFGAFFPSMDISLCGSECQFISFQELLFHRSWAVLHGHIQILKDDMHVLITPRIHSRMFVENAPREWWESLKKRLHALRITVAFVEHQICAITLCHTLYHNQPHCLWNFKLRTSIICSHRQQSQKKVWPYR